MRLGRRRRRSCAHAARPSRRRQTHNDAFLATRRDAPCRLNVRATSIGNLEEPAPLPLYPPPPLVDPLLPSRIKHILFLPSSCTTSDNDSRLQLGLSWYVILFCIIFFHFTYSILIFLFCILYAWRNFDDYSGKFSSFSSFCFL